MRRSLFIILVLFVACQGTKRVTNFSMENKIVTFDKVRLKLLSKAFGDITLKGYIALVRDSMICFKFYGPFSYEVLRGVYDEEFRLFDNYNNQLYSDALVLIERRTGFMMNRNVLEYMLCSKVSEFISELKKVNNENLRIETFYNKNGEDVVIFNLDRNSQIRLQFRTKNSVAHELMISYKDGLDNWSFDMNILSIINEPKKCNFGF